MCAAAVIALSIAHSGYLFPQMRGDYAPKSAEASPLMEAKREERTIV